MIRAIVTDIEGTTSDIRFVHRILFPYAREKLPAFLQRNRGRPEVATVLDDLRAEISRADATTEELEAVLNDFMDEDRKSTALKTLQGMIWREGYLSGSFTGHLYTDVPTALEQWQEQGIALYVYSSGSVAAQKLLFGYSDVGDLTPLFSGYFDTRVGAKRDVTSYRNIASQLGLPATELLFLSDIRQELDAAQEAGWATLQLIRDEADTESRHRQVSGFDQINQELLNP